jgi:hypothetical protein
MFRRFTTLIPAFALALLLVNAGHLAKAGYVSSGLECVRGDATPVDLEPGASTASTTVPADELPVVQESQKPVSRLTLAEFSPSSGMSPPEVEASAPQLDILVQHPPVRELRMAEWLGPEGRAALPPPMATGIFRPPRFLG